MGNGVLFIVQVLRVFVKIYEVIIIIRALLSWIMPDPSNHLYAILVRLTEPILSPLRRLNFIPMLDLSPIIAILLLNTVVQWILALIAGSALYF